MKKLGIFALALTLIFGLSAAATAVDLDNDDVGVDVDVANYAQIEFRSPSVSFIKVDTGEDPAPTYIDDPNYEPRTYNNEGFGYIAIPTFDITANGNFDLTVETSDFEDSEGNTFDNLHTVATQIQIPVGTPVTETSVGSKSGEIIWAVDYDIPANAGEIDPPGDYTSVLTLTVSDST